MTDTRQNSPLGDPVPAGMAVSTAPTDGTVEVIPAARPPRRIAAQPTRLVAVAVALPRALVTVPRRMSGALIFFLLIVVLPTIAAAYYYVSIASDQYVSESRFGVRFADLEKNDASAIFEGMPSASQIGLASTAITQYLQSREIVDELQKRIDIRRMFSSPSIDVLSRLSPTATIEQLVDYWRGKVDPFFDLTTGSISMKVKAFTPQDAQVISETVLSLSEALINDMSLHSREQTIKLNKDEVDAAATRLQAARQDMQAFRDNRAVIDTSKEAESRLSIVTGLRSQLADAEAGLTRLHSYMNDDAPTVRDTRTQIAALTNQLAQAESQLTSKDKTVSGGPLSGSVGGYEALEAKTLFAQKYYDTMMEALFKAQQDATRQMSYLAVFVHPAIPQSSLYPRRIEDTILVFLVCGGLWMLLLLGFRAVREHVI